MSQKMFQQNRENHPFPWCKWAFFCISSVSERVQSEQVWVEMHWGVYDFSVAKCEPVPCAHNPWDSCASCRWTPETWTNRGYENHFCRAQFWVGMLSDGITTAECRHSFLKWHCGFWRQLRGLTDLFHFQLNLLLGKKIKTSLFHWSQSSLPVVLLEAAMLWIKLQLISSSKAFCQCLCTCVQNVWSDSY